MNKETGGQKCVFQGRVFILLRMGARATRLGALRCGAERAAKPCGFIPRRVRNRKNFDVDRVWGEAETAAQRALDRALQAIRQRSSPRHTGGGRGRKKSKIENARRCKYAVWELVPRRGEVHRGYLRACLVSEKFFTTSKNMHF